MSTVALIYIRKSVVRYQEDRASPERQLANCVRVCDEKGWRYEVYEDAEGHRSGRSEKGRPAPTPVSLDTRSTFFRAAQDGGTTSALYPRSPVSPCHLRPNLL